METPTSQGIRLSLVPLTIHARTGSSGLSAPFCPLAFLLGPDQSGRWLVGAVGIEPTTFGLKGRCSTTELRPCGTNLDCSMFGLCSLPAQFVGWPPNLLRVSRRRLRAIHFQPATPRCAHSPSSAWRIADAALARFMRLRGCVGAGVCASIRNLCAGGIGVS